VDKHVESLRLAPLSGQCATLFSVLVIFYTSCFIEFIHVLAAFSPRVPQGK
jgi:hypothetical protein